MDISGNNRYELLFMDDESAALPAQNESGVSKKRQPNTAGQSSKKLPTTNAKKNLIVEKENKSGALNKNDAVNKKAAGQGKPKIGAPGSDKSRTVDGESRRVAFKSQNNEVREQRNNRRNFREGGEFGNEQRETRQFRDRDNRGPPRNREGGFRGGKREFDRQSGSDKTGKKCKHR
ncbi:hypothetical protein FF38_06721 [Lucilia cuprina]|uniref:Uncharacterized protein n=1 Tax=Lucilia cuprina TaxID=7375 RepID=A0A0L0C4K2_LUCCU|nr:hypothetical protein FF38_06721 [Lucilia cuprina]